MDLVPKPTETTFDYLLILLAKEMEQITVESGSGYFLNLSKYFLLNIWLVYWMMRGMKGSI